MLGPVEVFAGSQPVALGRAQMRTVLAALAVEVGRPVAAETLADRVWSGTPPKTWREVLYSHVTRIRCALAAVDACGEPVVLVRRPAGYLLDLDSDLVDLHRFRRLVGAASVARRTDPERVELLRSALALWRGTPLAGVPGSWADRMRTGWYQHRLEAVVAWADAELRLGNEQQVIVELRDLLGEHPLAEQLAGVLMRALAQDGRSAEALECFVALRARLADELGAEPASELQAVHRAILRGGQPPPLAATPARPARPIYPQPAQLPAAVPGFTGRRAALADLDSLLEGRGGQSIATVSGTAGVGKTALAVHWARRVAERFPDGQLYANLRGFDGSTQAVRPAAVVRRFLLAFGVPAQQVPEDPEAQVALYRSLLAGRRVLVLLDNARDCAQVRPLLPGGAPAFCLVTSRNQLTPLVAVEGAHPLSLDLLSAAEAHELLASRLGADRVDVEPAAAEQIVACCARLPLALSITAARIRQSGVPLGVLAEDLTDVRGRLSALDAGDPGSQVRAVFSWSYRALTPAAARLFRLLGVHPGPDVGVVAVGGLAGVPEAAARALLAELTGANLVGKHSSGRYACHDLLTAYAADQCRETETGADRAAATDRLIDHYLHTAYAADRLLNPARDPIPLPLAEATPGSAVRRPADDQEARAWLTAEHHVLLGVAQLAADTGHDLRAWQLAWVLDMFLHWRGFWHDRSRMWQLAVASAERLADPVAAAHAYRDLARANNRLRRYADSGDQLNRALEMFGRAGDRTGQAHTHRALASLCERQGRLRQALHHDERALALFAAVGHPQGQADALNSIGWDRCLLGDYVQALRCCRQALELHQRAGDKWGEATTWDSLGYAHHHLGGHAEAVHCYQRALTLVRALGDRYFEADTLTRLAETQEVAEDVRAARESLRAALDILLDLDHSDAEEVRTKLMQLQ
ncbi:BTAD domain-containing putative transcriptional regulator [Plantactinospora solaniradicis]|uniref:BTAD domain-containing putative transcriptional regulator n=1 Tax=Plantactinospora solaniradicis TaxID=1723736 RepID=A0ABW1KHX6_9ACTN